MTAIFGAGLSVGWEEVWVWKNERIAELGGEGGLLVIYVSCSFGCYVFRIGVGVCDLSRGSEMVAREWKNMI